MWHGYIITVITIIFNNHYKLQYTFIKTDRHRITRQLIPGQGMEGIRCGDFACTLPFDNAGSLRYSAHNEMQIKPK